MAARALKKTLAGLGLFAAKMFSGLIFAYVTALTGKEFVNFGLFSFFFLLLSLTGAFLYLVKGFKWTGLCIVNAVFAALVFGFGFYVNWAFSN